LISLFRQQEKVNIQTERNAEIKYAKDIRKINSFFSFHGGYIVFCKGKLTVFGTALTVNQDLKQKI